MILNKTLGHIFLYHHIYFLNNVVKDNVSEEMSNKPNYLLNYKINQILTEKSN